jgi:SAM-dependent methyltransferase
MTNKARPTQESISASQLWSGYYAAQVGRATRPVFDEALALIGPGRVGEARLAVELGCGDGTESAALLAQGWRVLATDREAEAIALLLAKVPPEHRERLEALVTPSEDLSLPPCDLVYAGYSLPFTPPGRFEGMWAGLVRALRPGGYFAGQFFGERDSWNTNPSMTFHTRAEALRLLAPLEVAILREREEDGNAFTGPKHWHIFDVIARKRGAA